MSSETPEAKPDFRETDAVDVLEAHLAEFEKAVLKSGGTCLVVAAHFRGSKSGVIVLKDSGNKLESYSLVCILQRKLEAEVDAAAGAPTLPALAKQILGG